MDSQDKKKEDLSTSDELRLDATEQELLYHAKPEIEFEEEGHVKPEFKLSKNTESDKTLPVSDINYGDELDILESDYLAISEEELEFATDDLRLDFDLGPNAKPITVEENEDDEDDDFEPEVIDYKEILKRSKENIIEDEPEYAVKEITSGATLQDLGTPEELIYKLDQIGYHCAPYLAAQIALSVNTKSASIRAILMEGPPGCGKSYLGKSLARLTGAEFMCLSCYPGMDLQQLIEAPSSMALAHAISSQGKKTKKEDFMNLGIISRAFQASQKKPVILLVDEIDKVQVGVDTFFLGPLQDAKIHLESGGVVEANSDNLLILFTKNFERPINDALLRRVQPISMAFLDSAQEEKILSNYCVPELISNLVRIADVMRYTDGAYKFERPPAPEELLKIGRYVTQLLDWEIVDFSFVGRNIWEMMAKSENDRQVLELMLRYHPDFHDTLYPIGRKLKKEQVHAKLAREVLRGIVADPEDAKRKKAYRATSCGLTDVGTPQELTEKLSVVKYECLPFLAVQISLVLGTPTEKVRTLLLEGPPGCGKSFLAKSLARICGADFMVLSCYSNMNLQHLIEAPSELAIANAMAGQQPGSKSDLMNLGIISRAFLKSQNQPVILLVDEIDKVETAIDTFFLGPLQDGTVYTESRPPIDANLDNLLVVLTKNYERDLNDALLRRVHPIKMTYLNSDLERKILSESCTSTLVDNLVSVVDRMRYSGGSYGFDRPPAPEELKTIGNYINQLLDWGFNDFHTIGKNVWNMLSKSEHDRAVLEHMMRFHPDYLDPLVPDGRNMSKDEVYAKLGRIILKSIIADPTEKQRQQAWTKMNSN